MKLALLLLTVVALTDLVSGDQVELLRLICANDKKVELTRASQLADLAHISSAQQEEAACSQRVLAAIVELDQLVNSDNDNVCSPAKIKHIRSYYAKYVDKKSLKRDNEAKLPKALKKLFLSFGFGVSRVCKSSMISSLMSDARSLLTEQDFEKVNTPEGSPLTKILKRPRDVDELVLPREMIAILLRKKGYTGISSEDDQGKVYVAMEPAVAQKARRVKNVCDTKFRPIYEQLILPVTSLSRIGLNYKGDDMADHLQEMKSNTDVHQWYRIVFLCETVVGLDIFDDPQDEAAKGDDKRNMVRLLTQDEAQELMAKSAEPVEPEQQINYQPAAEHKLDDLIVDKQDKNLKRLVDKFSANRSEMSRIRSKVTRQMMVFMKELLKSGKVSVVRRLLKRAKVSSMNEELVKMAEDYTNQIPPNGDDNDDETAVTTPDAHKRLRRDTAGNMAFVVSTIVVIVVVVLIFAVVSAG